MNANFNKCLELLLEHEGGFSDHPSDPGGATMKGITLSTYISFKGNAHLTAKDLKNISDKDVATIYKKRYWDACRADELVSGLDYCVFDVAVNSGVGRAIKFLQSCVGVAVDGGFGPTTMAAVAQFKGESAKVLIEDYCAKRLEFLKSLKTYETFGKGWKRRVEEVEAEALKMLG